MLFFTFLSLVADRFISSSRLFLRWWSSSLSFESKHRSSKQWPKRPRSRSPLEVVSIYLASFRCKLHCACRITRTTTFLSSALDVSPANVVLTEFTLRSQPACPHRRARTIRSRRHSASSHSHGSQPYRSCPRVLCRECKRNDRVYSNSARPVPRATKCATLQNPPLEAALRRAEVGRAPQKRFRLAYRHRFSIPLENGRLAF